MSAQILALVLELAALFPNGMHTELDAQARQPLAMVEAFVMDAHHANIVRDYEWLEDAIELRSDELTAGTLLPEAVPGLVPGAAASAVATRLVAAGARFGFDGLWQNGCAAPTELLLVLDTASGTVYGIDLHPCRG